MKTTNTYFLMPKAMKKRLNQIEFISYIAVFLITSENNKSKFIKEIQPYIQPYKSSQAGLGRFAILMMTSTHQKHIAFMQNKHIKKQQLNR